MATKTFSPRPRDIERRWYVVDADGAILGRLASEVAQVLRGKHKPIFASHADTGDHVIVVNAARVRLTGGKEQKKVYYRHSGYPGGLRETDYARLLEERPVLAVEKAIKGMLPKNRLGRQIAGKLSVYEGPEHPHEAQQPAPLAVGEIPPWHGLPQAKAAAAPDRRDGRASEKSKARGSAGAPGSGAKPAGRGPAAKGSPASAAQGIRRRIGARSQSGRRKES